MELRSGRQGIGFSPEIETTNEARSRGDDSLVARGLASRLRLKPRFSPFLTTVRLRRQGIGFSPEIETISL